MIKYISSDTSPLIMQTTMPQPPLYPTMVLTYHPSEWPNGVYVPNDMSMQYTAGIPPASYPPYMNPAGNENHDVGRENSRRSIRGRGLKRGEGYNRNNQNNDIPFYSVPCISEQYTSMFCSPNFPELMSQQHPAAGQPVFSCMNPQQVYPQQPTMHLQSHTNFPQYHHSSQMKYNRQSQSSIQSNGGEPVKNSLKSFDKRNNPKSSRQLNDDKNSKQTIRATVIVNNSNMEPFVDTADSNAALKNNKSINNNKVAPFNVKIDYNFVSTRNETYGGAEKNDGPCVNIKSSIEIEQNGENDLDNKNETVSSHIQTTLLKTQSTAPVKDDNSVESGEVLPSMKSQQACNPVQVDDLPKISTWASILKKNNNDTPLTVTAKPTAFINPITATDSSDISSNEVLHSPELPHVEQKLVQNNVPVTQEKTTNETQAQHKVSNITARDHDFDDPLTYRMGGKF